MLKPKSSGLILLVVLAMLTLFSMLAISYVVFSGHARSANLAMARKDFRGTPPPRLLDQAVKIALRGTVDPSSSLLHHDLLGDLYGQVERPLKLRVRHFQAAAPNANLASVVGELPTVSGGTFVKIPIMDLSGAFANLPVAYDDLTGRVLTFQTGPLRHQSFRIVRSFGDLRNSTIQVEREHAFSVVIDLSSIPNETVSATVRRASTTTFVHWNQSIADWRNYDFLNLFYADAGGNVDGGWELMINAAPLNAHGTGITSTGASQTVRLNSPFDDPAANFGTARGEFPIALQPNLAAIPHQTVQPGGTSSDSDEGYDAPDYANFYLYHRTADGTDQWPPLAPDEWKASDYIIPSFHRAALINYLVNESDPASYSQPADLFAVLQRIQAMTGRPLSYVVRPDNNPNNPPFSPVVNPNFSGSNQGLYPAPDNFRIPQLNVVFDGNWATNGLPVFQNWVRQLTRGPWDVDNDDDGVNDSIWTDPNLPLITSPEGKLLKILVAYQIEDLDSRLDMNAVGDIGQSQAGYANLTTPEYAQYDTATSVGQSLAQGFGYGPAETSLRHLFAAGPTGNAEYQNFIWTRQRYASATTLPGAGDVPGRPGDDLYSILGMRETPIWYTGTTPNFFTATSINHRWRYYHGTLPGLPLATRGRQALGIDLHGNPLLLNGADGFNTAGNPPFDEGFNDSYERRFSSGDPGDSPYTFSDWERLERRYDLDRSSMPSSLERLVGANPNLARLLTPMSRHLRHTPFVGNRTPGGNSSTSFRAMMQAIAAIRPVPSGGTAIDLSDQKMFADLFPFEFAHAEGLNLNRALGNGIDDDGDGQFDEPQELSAQQSSLIVVNGDTVTVGPTYIDDYLHGASNLDPSWEDPNFDSQHPNNPRKQDFSGSQLSGSETRQLLARHLYCLAMLILPDPLTPSNRLSTSPVTGADRARMIAQWAVNVVDFRDADVAMTRFPYDPNPFALGKRDASNNPVFWYPDPVNPPVVWGMEQPELALTESLATHNLRVRDTKADPSGDDIAGGDMDYDQLRIPEGSAFLELRNLRTTGAPDNQSMPGVPNNFYTTIVDNNGSTLTGLNLAAMSPIVNINGDSVAFPVWRIALSQPHSVTAKLNSGSTIKTPFELTLDATARSQVSYQFRNLLPGDSNVTPTGLNWNLSNTSETAPPIDRVIWFTSNVVASKYNLPDVTLPNPDDPVQARSRVFDNFYGDPVVLQGGQHLVIGPRAVTYFGSKKDAFLAPTLPVNLPNNHRIVLQNQINSVQNNTPPAFGNWVTLYEGDNNGTIVERRPALTPSRTITMRAATDTPWDSTAMPSSGTLPDSIGFNVSAPHPTATEFYKTPTDQLNSDNDQADPDNDAPGFKFQDADAYHDFHTATGMLENEPFDGRDSVRYPLGYEQTWGPGYANGIPNPGTMENWCTAYLQRLADPERPWHGTFNPYITVDWLPIDLTVFSGEETISGANPEYKFATRQKTGVKVAVDAPVAPATVMTAGETFLSTASETIKTKNTPVPNSEAFFDVQLPLDLSDFSDPTLPLTRRPTNAFDSGNAVEHFSTLGYINSTFRLHGEADISGRLAPYVSNFEGAAWFPNGGNALPPASALWLNRQFANVYELALVPVSSPGQFMQEFGVASGTANYYAADARSPYSYLMNWFQEPKAAGGSPPFVQKFVAPAAIFELVSTPSPWADAYDYIPASSVSNNLTLNTLHAPYNRVSRFVEPGKVNINTISDPRVWQGLMWNISPVFVTRDAAMPTPPFWDTSGLTGTRRGYAPTAGNIPNGNPFLHPDYPTQFAGVFKSSFEAGFVPTLRSGAQLDGASATNPVNATLARTGASNAPLFSLTQPTPSIPRNPFEDFHYFGRLANLTTTRSNVFSIRATIGYFEYDAASGLGPEYGADQGTSRRHRGFYVVDRSVPVGYEEGQDWNTDNCILLRRILE